MTKAKTATKTAGQTPGVITIDNATGVVIPSPSLAYIARFKGARTVGVPAIAITTADQTAAITSLVQGMKDTTPVVQWDTVRGLRGLTQAGEKLLTEIGDPSFVQAKSTNPVMMLQLALGFPKGTILFLLNGHRVVDQFGVMQCLHTMRDEFKASKRTVVLLCPAITLPVEIAQDVLVIDIPLPNETELADIVKRMLGAANLLDLNNNFVNGVEPSTPETMDLLIRQSVNALRGASHFPAEQSTALALRPDGLNVKDLETLKVKMIEATQGLTVYTGGLSFADIDGLYQAKEFFNQVINGQRRFRVLVFIDEIEKAMAGSGSDSSGVSQAFHGTLLSYMSDRRAMGAIFLGPPGSGKSVFAKALGTEAGVPTLIFDLGAMKGGIVGQSEEQLRAALKVITAIGGDEILFIATSNNIGSLSPEMKRRFTLGTFFFDLPDAEERGAIWKLYLGKYGLTEPLGGIFFDDGWTGAEIEQCCERAWMLNLDIVTASKYIVPVSRYAKDIVDDLRKSASGRYLSATKPGVFDIGAYKVTTAINAATGPARAVNFTDDETEGD